MGNSSMVVYTKLSPHHSGKRTAAIDRITPHCVVGQCTIEALGAEFAKPEKGASCNYGIGADGRVGLIVEEDNRSWCSSSTTNDNRAVTIECASDTTAPWAFRPVVYQTLVQLCADICRRHGKSKLLWISDKNTALAYQPAADEMILTVHRWFANKACPGDWMMARMGELASSVTAQLTPAPTPEPAGDPEYEAWKKHYYRLRKELQDNDASAYSAEDRAWAISTGLIKGGAALPDGTPNYMWEDFLTREQAIALLHRLSAQQGMK